MYISHVVDFCPSLSIITCYKSANSWYIKDGDNKIVKSKHIDGKDSTHVFEINNSLNSRVNELLCHKSSYNDKVVFLITKKDYEYHYSKFYEYKQKYDYVYKPQRLYILPKTLKQMWFRTIMISDDMKKIVFILLNILKKISVLMCSLSSLICFIYS
jgi:hypothetical protein